MGRQSPANLGGSRQLQGARETGVGVPGLCAGLCGVGQPGLPGTGGWGLTPGPCSASPLFARHPQVGRGTGAGPLALQGAGRPQPQAPTGRGGMHVDSDGETEAHRGGGPRPVQDILAGSQPPWLWPLAPGTHGVRARGPGLRKQGCVLAGHTSAPRACRHPDRAVPGTGSRQVLLQVWRPWASPWASLDLDYFNHRTGSLWVMSPEGGPLPPGHIPLARKRTKAISLVPPGFVPPTQMASMVP